MVIFSKECVAKVVNDVNEVLNCYSYRAKIEKSYLNLSKLSRMTDGQMCLVKWI